MGVSVILLHKHTLATCTLGWNRARDIAAACSHFVHEMAAEQQAHGLFGTQLIQWRGHIPLCSANKQLIFQVRTIENGEKKKS